MTLFWKIAAITTCLAVMGVAAILWVAHNRKATERKLAATARVIRLRADQGDVKAQYRLGFMYRRGQGVPQDNAEAVRWWRKTAEQGYADGEYALSFMYRKGQGIPQDFTEAVRWCRKSAEQSDALAQYVLGLMYYRGQGVPQDYAEASRWYRKAAVQGNADSQHDLGFMYYLGQGVPQDYAEASRWYRKAADQGDTRAQGILCYMYRQGQGVQRNYAEAVRWYGKIAASCLTKDGPLVAWTYIAVILFGLPVMVVPIRRWGRAKWLSSALCAATCATMLVHELLSESLPGLLARCLLGITLGSFERILWLALIASVSAFCAVEAVVEAARGSKRDGEQGQPPTPSDGALKSPA